MVQTHQDSREEGTTKPIPPQETKKICQFEDKPSKVHNDDPTDQMFVFFSEKHKVGIKTVKKYCQRMQEENITRAVLHCTAYSRLQQGDPVARYFGLKRGQVQIHLIDLLPKMRQYVVEAPLAVITAVSLPG
uniref:Polymerase (RNA) II (DNA directed) polypeptide E, b n=1 Tax=Oncorhynchus mykiss TaxID=8022 RepID=A0A8K9XA41_ONCMY